MENTVIYTVENQISDEKFVELCRAKGFHTETGEFGAYMQVDSLNDGPLTLVVDTDQL